MERQDPPNSYVPRTLKIKMQKMLSPYNVTLHIHTRERYIHLVQDYNISMANAL